MTLVKSKAETREAWQYTGTLVSAPAWVQACCFIRWFEDKPRMLLSRRSGLQAIGPGEWLIRNLDGEPEWLTHEQMRKTFDEVVRAEI